MNKKERRQIQSRFGSKVSGKPYDVEETEKGDIEDDARRKK